MPRSENTDLIVSLSLKDNLSGPLAAAKQNVDALGESVNVQSSRLSSGFAKFGDTLESNRSKIREFSRAGTELRTVAAALGPEFEEAIGPVGEFVHIAGTAGLITESLLDLGPAAAKAAAGVLGLGTASATAAPEVAALGAAADTAAAGGIGTLAAVLGGLAAPVAAVAAVGGSFILFEQAANSEAAKTNTALNEQRFALSDLGQNAGLAGPEIAAVAQATHTAGVAIDDLGGHVDESSRTLKGWGGIVAETLAKNSQFFHQFTDDVKDTGAGLDNVERAALAAREALDKLPGHVPIAIDFTININGKPGVGTAADLAGDVLGSTAGLATPNAAGGSALASQLASDRAAREAAAAEAARKAQQAADEARRKALQAADEAARKAKQAAEELARAYRERVSVEFDHAKKTADTLFDALHNRIDKAIDDAEKLAQTQHDAALQAIADNLKAEEAKHAAPVDAAQAALDARQREEARRNLVEAQQAAAAAASANTDPGQAAALARQLRDATEALANFDAQAAIDRLKAVQAGQDAASEAAAKAATAQADAKLQAAKDEAQKERDAETLAAKKRKDDFEVQLAALEKRDTALGKTPKQIQADIEALEKRFGITTDALGFHHIEDPLVSAIKDVKIPAPNVTVINNQKFLLQIGPNELRLIASAVQQGNQPAATSSVRTGANGRG